MELLSLDQLKSLDHNHSITHLSEVMADLLYQLDPNINHDHKNWIPKITSLSNEKRAFIVDELHYYITYLQQFIHSGGSFHELISKQNEAFFVRRSLFRRGLEYVDSNVESRFRDGDIIEVYDSSGVQICRSWSYFKNCSYSLTDLLSFSWSELYSRPRLIEKELMTIMHQLFAKDAKTLDYDLPEYVISEKFSSKKYSFLFAMKYGSPLRDKKTKQIVACVTIGELKKLGTSHLPENTHFI